MNRRLYLTAAFICGLSTILFGADWGYDPPKVVPTKWGTIEGFEICQTGSAQSPIDFSQSSLTPESEKVHAADLPNIKFSYRETPLNIINNGHTVEVEYEPGSTIRLSEGGPLYSIIQFHFHAPSEHSFENGALFDMEMHIVHKNLNDPKRLAVIGVMIKEGAENSALKPVWEHLNKITKKDEKLNDSKRHINIEAALPEDRRYFAYQGSLTTPPCSEVVDWRVLKQPIEMSRDQIRAFVAVLNDSCCAVNGNNRPRQALHGRSVKLDNSPNR